MRFQTDCNKLLDKKVSTILDEVPMKYYTIIEVRRKSYNILCSPILNENHQLRTFMIFGLAMCYNVDNFQRIYEKVYIRKVISELGKIIFCDKNVRFIGINV
jgi:hypothetical protein